MTAARHLTHLLWNCDEDASEENFVPPNKEGHVGSYRKADSSTTEYEPQSNVLNRIEPLHGKAALAYGGLTPQRVAAWFQTLCTEGLPTDPRSPRPRPNEQQRSILQRVLDRCLQESVDEGNDVDFRSEPLRFLLHGVLGAGKSEVLKWLRDFFENVCLWTHGQ